MQKPTLNLYIMSTYTGDSISAFYKHYFSVIECKLGIQLNVRVTHWHKALNLFIQGFKNDEAPDIFQLGTTWVNTFAHLGYLSAVPDSLTTPSLTPWMDDICNYHDTRVAIPWLIETSMLIANHEQLTKANIVSKDIGTIDMFKATCHRLYEHHTANNMSGSPILPLATSLRPEIGRLHLLIPFIWSFGWDFPDFYHLDSSFFDYIPLKSAYDYLKALFQAAHLDKNTATLHPYLINEQFYENNLYTFSIGHWWKIVMSHMDNTITSDTHAPNLEALPVPSGPAGHFPWGGGSVLCVSSKTSYPDEAWAVAEALRQPEYTENRACFCGDLPAYPCSFWDEHRSHPQFATIYNEILQSKSYPKHPLWMPYEKIFSEGFSNLLWRYTFEDQPFDSLYESILTNVEKNIRNLDQYAWGVTK